VGERKKDSRATAPGGAGRPTAEPGVTRAASSPLAALVARCVDRLEDEGPAVLDAMCAEHPEHAAALRERVERLRRFGLLGAPPEQVEVPERLGGFRILSPLGRGGMGVVYLAEQEELHRRVALKLVRPEHLYFPGARERFRREIAAVARLQHPGIVPVHAAGEAAGVPFFAMEFVRGAALEEVLAALAGSNPARLTGADLRRAVGEVAARHAAPATTGAAGASAAPGHGSSGSQATRLFDGSWSECCLRIAQQVALALQHAHEHGVLHRDVKPSNVMLTPGGRVLLLDFGLAATEGDHRITRSGSLVGSLAWMSPEQVRGGAVDARTDVYSLGATLYELLTLRSPFTAEGVEETRQRILEGRALPVRDLNPAVPRDAETVCLKAMDRDAERRYPTAAEFADDIGNALELRPVLARRPGALLKARRWAQRHPGAAAAAALGALLLVGGPAGYGVVQSRNAAREKQLNENLSAANTRLDAALGEESRQRELAEKSFDKALSAVDQMLADVGADDLRDLPQLEPVRGRLLQRALDFYIDLEAQAPENVTVRKEQGRTHREIADLLRELGRSDEARERYQRGVDQLAALIAQTTDPSELTDLHYTHASIVGQLGSLDWVQGRREDAALHWSEARAELEALVALPDSRPAHAHDLATMHVNLGMLASAAGREEEAADLFRKAAEVIERVPDSRDLPPDFPALRADALNKLASTANRLGRAEESERDFAEAWTLYVAALAKAPTDRSIRNGAVECASNYGVLLLGSADHERAEGVLREGFRIATGLATDFPQEPEYGMRAAVIGLNLVAELVNEGRGREAEPIADEATAQLERTAANHPDRVQAPYYLTLGYAAKSAIHLQMGSLPAATEEAQRAIDHARTARSTLGESPAVMAQLACALFQQADVLQASGDPATALERVEEGLGFGLRRPDVLFMAAETLAHATRSARDSKALEPAAREELQRRLEDRALAALKEALATGFTDLERLRTSDDWKPLRDHPQWTDIVPGKAQE